MNTLKKKNRHTLYPTILECEKEEQDQVLVASQKEGIAQDHSMDKQITQIESRIDTDDLQARVIVDTRRFVRSLPSIPSNTNNPKRKTSLNVLRKNAILAIPFTFILMLISSAIICIYVNITTLPSISKQITLNKSNLSFGHQNNETSHTNTSSAIMCFNPFKYSDYKVSNIVAFSSIGPTYMSIKIKNEDLFNQANLSYMHVIHSVIDTAEFFVYKPEDNQLFTKLIELPGISNFDITDHPYDQYFVNMKLMIQSGLTNTERNVLLYINDNNKIKYFMNLKDNAEELQFTKKILFDKILIDRQIFIICENSTGSIPDDFCDPIHDIGGVCRFIIEAVLKIDT